MASESHIGWASFDAHKLIDFWDGWPIVANFQSRQVVAQSIYDKGIQWSIQINLGVQISFHISEQVDYAVIALRKSLMVHVDIQQRHFTKTQALEQAEPQLIAVAQIYASSIWW